MSIKADLESITDVNSVFCQQPMSQYTSFKVGGPAEYIVMPRAYNQVAEVVQYCNRAGIKWYVMGRGTNLLVSDCGLKGVVIAIEENLAEIRVAGTTIVAQAGAALPRVSSIARASSLSGLEFASGIPGSVGGAVAMNAGAYDGEMKNVLRRVLAVNTQGELETYNLEDMELGYRSSVFQSNGAVIVEAEMELLEGDSEEIQEKINEFTRRRRDKQPLDKASAGSTFKRPPGHYAGQLIDSANLRGYCLGGAAVSEKHCGFIINANQASAQEIYDLIGKIRAEVRDKCNVELEPEVKIWGNFRE